MKRVHLGREKANGFCARSSMDIRNGRAQNMMIVLQQRQPRNLRADNVLQTNQDGVLIIHVQLWAQLIAIPSQVF